MYNTDRLIVRYLTLNLQHAMQGVLKFYTYHLITQSFSNGYIIVLLQAIGMWLYEWQPVLSSCFNMCQVINPDSKVHGDNMGPSWVLSAPDGPHVGPMNLTIRKSSTLPIRQRASGALPCSQRSVNPSSINWIIVHLFVMCLLWSSTGHSLTTYT